MPLGLTFIDGLCRSDSDVYRTSALQVWCRSEPALVVFSFGYLQVLLGSVHMVANEVVNGATEL